MKSDYDYPECNFYGPTAPRIMLFILAWEAAHGAPAAACEALVAQYPGEVDNVLAEWGEITGVSETLFGMRARIAARATMDEIEGEKR